MGRGVSIPKFGIFTFTPPEVRLKVPSPSHRELQISSNEINNLARLSFSFKKSLLRELTFALPSSFIKSSGLDLDPIVLSELLDRCL